MTKEELRQYRTIKLELEQFDREREYWYTKAERCVRSPSRAPGYGGEHDPYPDIIDKLDAVKVQAARKCKELLALRHRIEIAIDGLDSRERYIMRARYVEGLRWEEIAERMSYAWAQVHRIHSSALQKLDTQ